LGLFFFLCKCNENLQLGRVFVHHRISAVKRVEFISYSMSYIVQSSLLRYHCFECACTNWEKNWWFKRQFLWGIRASFRSFSYSHMKRMPGDFNEKLGRMDIFRPTIGNESLHQDSNDKGVRTVNFATSESLVVKITTFPHPNIH